MIDGKWARTIGSKTKNFDKHIHFVQKGSTHALCGRGRDAALCDKGSLKGFVEPEGYERCATCLKAAKGIENARKRIAARFIEVLEQLELASPAAAMQIAMAWPANTQEDHTAEWWSTHAPAMIQDMKETL